MAGYYEMKDRQGCWSNWYDSFNDGVVSYTFDRKYWMPPGKEMCTNNALGSTCTFYGPMTAPRTTQESFLEGRGQIESDKCPECGVIYLPDSVFAMTKGINTQGQICEDMTLQPEFTRQPKSCFTLSETEQTTYAFMPEAFQKGYTGYNSMCDIHIQSREDARLESRAFNNRTPSATKSYSNAY